MYDYMKALQKRFDRQAHPELDNQVKSAQEELRRDMDAAGRRKLLRLIGTQNSLLVESKLMSFTAGFKLAWGMAKSWRQTGSTPSNGRKKNTSAIRRNRRTKWRNEDRPVTAWYASGRMAAGKAASWWDTRTTVTPSSGTSPRPRKRTVRQTATAHRSL